VDKSKIVYLDFLSFLPNQIEVMFFQFKYNLGIHKIDFDLNIPAFHVSSAVLKIVALFHLCRNIKGILK